MTKKSIGASIVTIAIGAAIGFGAKEYAELNRYPIFDEFYIMEKCNELSGNQLDLEDYQKKVTICACALENTQKEYSYKDVLNKKKQKSFLEKFKDEVNKC
jgi:hypothetical protein